MGRREEGVIAVGGSAPAMKAAAAAAATKAAATNTGKQKKMPKKRSPLHRSCSSEPTTFVNHSNSLRLTIGRRQLRRLTPTDLPFHSSFTRLQFRSLQRPRKKPLQEYYNDDDAELEGGYFSLACHSFFSCIIVASVRRNLSGTRRRTSPVLL